MRVIVTAKCAVSPSLASGGNFRRNNSGPRYTSSSIRKFHLLPARNNRSASLPSNLSVCWYESRESLSMSVSSVLFLVELESALDVAAPRFFNAVGGVTTPPRGSCRRISIMNVTLPFVEILDHSQRLLVIMTMNSLVPAFADHQ